MCFVRRAWRILRCGSALGVDSGMRAGIWLEGAGAAGPRSAGMRFDRTEVDMRWGGLLVEAKLTESDFQTRAGYQLIRNVLAAYAEGCSFCVVHDERRPDLREAWFQVMAAVKTAEMRVRCKVMTWQELAALAAGGSCRSFWI
jgi:hypothetical protein